MFSTPPGDWPTVEGDKGTRIIDEDPKWNLREDGEFRAVFSAPVSPFPSEQKWTFEGIVDLRYPPRWMDTISDKWARTSFSPVYNKHFHFSTAKVMK